VRGAIKDARAEACASNTAYVVPMGYFTVNAPLVPVSSTYCSSTIGKAAINKLARLLVLGCAGEHLIRLDDSGQV